MNTRLSIQAAQEHFRLTKGEETLLTMTTIGFYWIFIDESFAIGKLGP